MLECVAGQDMMALQTEQIRELFDSTVSATKEDITRQSKNNKPGAQRMPNMARTHMVIPRVYVDSHYKCTNFKTCFMIDSAKLEVKLHLKSSACVISCLCL